MDATYTTSITGCDTTPDADADADADGADGAGNAAREAGDE